MGKAGKSVLYQSSLPFNPAQLHAEQTYYLYVSLLYQWFMEKLVQLPCIFYL